MFERFNESARRALFFARYETSRVGDRVIEPRHLLLGVFRENDAVTAELWRMFDVKPREIRDQSAAVADRISSSAELPVSEDGQRILALAVAEADKRGDPYVGPCHLVLAMLSIPECEPAILLRNYGLEYERVSEIATPLIQEVSRRTEIEEQTWVTFRASQYEIFDRLADSMKLRESRRENRRRVALAIMDAATDSPIMDEPFSSIEELTARIRRLLSGN